MESPLSDELARAGGRFGDSGRAGPPADFGDARAEYAAARTAAAIVDRSALTKIELRGRDRAQFLHNLCTNDIKGLAPGHGCEAFLTNAQGKVLAFVRVFAGPESISLDTVPGAAESLLKHLDRYLIIEKVELADRSPDWAQFLIIGPRSSEVVAALGIAVPVAARGIAPSYMQITEAAVADGPCQLLTSSSLGLPSYELRVPADRAVSVWRQVRAAGGANGLRLMGGRALEMIRIEAGLPVYGLDIDESNLPQEIGRTRLTISFTKGCYIGQETVARIDAMGHVNRQLMGLILASREPPPRGASIAAAGKPIGQVRSAAFSPALDSAIALGYVRRGHDKAGARVDVNFGETQLTAIVSELPFPPPDPRDQQAL